MKLLRGLIPAVVLVLRTFAQELQEEDLAAFDTMQADSHLNPELWLDGVLSQEELGEGLQGDVYQESHRQLYYNRFSGCQTLKVWIRKSDIQKAALAMANGYSFQIPFYNDGTTQQRGVWYEQLTYANRQQSMGAGLVTLKFDINTSLSMSVVAGQRQLAILGGTGSIFGACPAGYGVVIGDVADIVHFEFTICDACS
jgi:hypothetical protein